MGHTWFRNDVLDPVSLFSHPPFPTFPAQFQTHLLSPLWQAVQGQQLLEDPFLDEVRAFAQRGSAAMVDALRRDATLFPAFRRRLERALPDGAENTSAFLQHELEQAGGHAPHHDQCDIKAALHLAEASQAAAPRAKRAKHSESSAVASLTSALDSFEAGMARWQQHVSDGHAVPSWFEDAVCALGRELA